MRAVTQLSVGARVIEAIRREGQEMLTLFQKSLLGTIALAGLLLALVIAAKTPAQATTISPAVQVPIGLVPPGIVTTGDATVRVKPDAAIVTVGAIAPSSTAPET